jgi:lipid-A-disaccharide synthase
MARPTLFVSAGDVSGDNAASRVISILRNSHPELEFFGLGGRRLRFLGQQQLAEPSDLNVLGFWEVARHYPYFRKLFYRCVEKIALKRPGCVLLVDYPGFNLRLARRAKKLGIPVVYYISPQVWAWGKRRLKIIKECVDLMLVILPFEVEFYRKAGVPAEFVGHYLLEDIPSEYISTQAPNKHRLALLPGSRTQEVERMLPPMLETARILHERHGLEAVVAGISGAFDYDRALAGLNREAITICYDDTRRVLYESGLVLTKSGTATLETGIIGRPMVIVYKIGLISYLIARRLVKLDMIGLANLVMGDRVVPELIQQEATPQRMATEIEKYLTGDSYRSSVIEELHTIPGRLGGGGASEKAADIIGRFL